MVRKLIRSVFRVAAVILVIETAYALLRRTPELEDFDPSGDFGDPGSHPLRIAVLGDSSVTAPGVSGPDDIWVRIVSRRLAERHNVLLRSFAVGGATVAGVTRHQLEPALAFNPDLVFLSVGANDALRGFPVAIFGGRLERLVGTLSGSGAIVIQSGVGDLGTIPRLQPPLRHLLSRRSITFDRAHKKVAARHGTWVVEQRSDDRGLWLRDRSLWAEDLFHVSASGHRRWADTVWRTLEPVLEPRATR